MDGGDAASVFPIFFGVWMLLGLGSFAFFHLNRNAVLKRKVWPIVVLLSGILFIGFIWKMGIRGNGVYMAVPAVVLISLLNLRATKFCDSCGRTLHNQGLFSAAEYCPKCGVKLP